MHANISAHLVELRTLCARFRVARLELFGSAARGADFDPARSDADFLVEFDPARPMAPLEQFFGLSEALERVLGRSVDLVEAAAVRNPYVRAQIDQARELIYAA